MAYITFYVEDVPFNDVWTAFKKLSLPKRIEVLNNYAREYQFIYTKVIWQSQNDSNYYLDRGFFDREHYPCLQQSELTKAFKKKIKKDLCHRVFYKMILKVLAK